MLRSPTRGEKITRNETDAPGDQRIIFGYTSSDKIYRIFIPWDHKVTETRQIHWTTKTIIPLGTTMEPLLAEESYATVYPLSRPIATTTIEKPNEQNRSGQIIQPTSKEFSSIEPSKEFCSSEDSLPEIPEQPGTPPSPPPLVQQQQQQHAPVVPSVEMPGPSRRSARISTKVQTSYKKQLRHHVQLVSSVIPDENPTTYRQAVNSSLKEQWTSAMNDEINPLKKNKTFDVVNKLIGRNIVSSKWVFKTKKNADATLERFRARAIAQGFSQAPGFDFKDTFAPVIRYESLGLLLAICTRNKWRPREFDVKSAFLYGKLKEEVYMRPPPGFSDGDKVWKLNRYI